MGPLARPKPEPFRFLTRDEVRKLPQEQRAEYLRRAIEAVRNGHPLHDLPIDELLH